MLELKTERLNKRFYHEEDEHRYVCLAQDSKVEWRPARGAVRIRVIDGCDEVGKRFLIIYPFCKKIEFIDAYGDVRKVLNKDDVNKFFLWYRDLEIRSKYRWLVWRIPRIDQGMSDF